MGKRERENPCGICGHYHKYEEGETCETCGHRLDITAAFAAVHVSSFPTEILSGFIYLGTYDNASRVQLLATQGITHVLNTVPACQSLYMKTFAYHSIQADEKFPYEDAMQFLEQCERDKARVLVHCMTGKSRSPAVVIAYLMKSKGWRLAQSHRWVKDRRPSVELSAVFYQQLEEYERKLLASKDNMASTQSSNSPPFSIGSSKPNDPVVSASDNLGGGASEFSAFQSIIPENFIFGAGEAQQRSTVDSTLGTNSNMFAINDASMD